MWKSLLFRDKQTFQTKCSLFGKPNSIISDGGPLFVGPHFKPFFQEWDVEHMASSPRHAKANGFAECMVGTIKDIIKKCSETKTDINTALPPCNPGGCLSSLPWGTPFRMANHNQLATSCGTHIETNGHQELSTRTLTRSYQTYATVNISRSASTHS